MTASSLYPGQWSRIVCKSKESFLACGKDQGTGYLELDGRKRAVSGIVDRTETIDVLKTNRDDLMINLDFDKDDRLIGIEVVSFD